MTPSGAYRARGAVLQVVPHQLTANSTKRFVNRRYLGEYVGAVSIVSDHLLESPHLPLDTPKSFEVSRLHIGIDRKRFSRARRIAYRAPTLGGGYGVARSLSLISFISNRHIVSPVSYATRARRSLRLFVTTLTELSAIAALAMIGLSITPVNG